MREGRTMLVWSTFLHLHSVETPYANPPFLFSPILLPIECQFGPIRSKWGKSVLFTIPLLDRLSDSKFAKFWSVEGMPSVAILAAVDSRFDHQGSILSNKKKWDLVPK